MVANNLNAPIISFIVPVFNAEQYLHACLDSITCQLEGNELILVDDGSKDASGSICDEYASKYPEIKVVHTENMGASYARNLGVDISQGVYIVYVDSDDFINTDFSVKFKELDISADVVFFPMRKLLKNGELIKMNDDISADILRNKNAEEALYYISNCSQFPASPCGKLILRKFLTEHHIGFSFNRISEDYDWTYQLLQCAESFDYFEGGLYTYRQIAQSRSAMGKAKSVEDQLVILRSWERRAVSDSFRKYLNSFLAYEYAMILPFYGALNKKEKSIYRNDMCSARYLLRYGKSRKLKLIRCVCNIIGLDMTACILFFYINLRNKRYGK